MEKTELLWEVKQFFKSLKIQYLITLWILYIYMPNTVDTEKSNDQFQAPQNLINKARQNLKKNH